MSSPSANRALRVLQVVHGLPRGGLENGVINLLNGLAPEQFEQAVCCMDLRGEMAERIDRPLPLHVLHRNRHDLNAPVRLARLIREWRPDLIHCRNWNTWFDSVLAHRLSGRQGKLIWSFHGFAEGYWFPRRRAIASRFLASLTDGLFAVCQDSAQRYAELTGIPVERFGVLYNGVDCERFRPARNRSELRASLGLREDDVVVLTVASLTPVKGHAQLLDAAAQVLSGTKRRVQFLWIGEGSERAALERRIAEHGIAASVRMAGASDRVPEYLAAADLFVLPSRLEGMSNAILEAMASGIPVIANRVGGNRELVGHENCGLLTHPSDAGDMAAAISRLVADDDLRRKMGSAARARAETVFSLDAMLQRYSSYYRSAAGMQRSGASGPAEHVSM